METIGSLWWGWRLKGEGRIEDLKIRRFEGGKNRRTKNQRFEGRRIEDSKDEEPKIWRKKWREKQSKTHHSPLTIHPLPHSPTDPLPIVTRESWLVSGEFILIPDTWYLIPDTWYLIPDTWYLIPDTWYLILDTWYQVLILDTRRRRGELGSRYLILDTNTSSRLQTEI